MKLTSFLLGVMLLTGCASQPDSVAEQSSAEDLRGVCSSPHEHLEHTHRAKCGHKSVKHDDHLDYEHDGHLDCQHFGHYDVRQPS